MRDEAHRFAIASHKKWKRREDLESRLRRQGRGQKEGDGAARGLPLDRGDKGAGVEGIARPGPQQAGGGGDTQGDGGIAAGGRPGAFRA